MNRRTDNDVFWYGVHVEDLTRQELINAVKYLVRAQEEMRVDREMWRKAGNVRDYLAQKP